MENIPPPHSGTCSSESEKDSLLFCGLGLGCQKVLCQLCIGRLHKYVREAVLLRRLRFS